MLRTLFRVLGSVPDGGHRRTCRRNALRPRSLDRGPLHGKYYVFSTGRGAPFYSSPDTITWTREGSVFTAIPDAVHAAVPKNNGTDVWAPDIIRLNNQFYLYYAVSSWGSFQSAIGLATNPVLDPKDPTYK